MQLARVKEVISKDNKSKIADETREKLAFLNNVSSSEEDNGFTIGNRLSCIKEVNTTGMFQ